MGEAAVDIQIEMPIKGRSRFVAIAQRDERGRMAWRWVWDGNQSKAGLARHRRALRRLRADGGGAPPRPPRCARRPVLPTGLTPTRLGPASLGASPAGAGHPGRRDACLFLSIPALRPCRAGLSCFRRVPC